LLLKKVTTTTTTQELVRDGASQAVANTEIIIYLSTKEEATCPYFLRPQHSWENQERSLQPQFWSQQHKGPHARVWPGQQNLVQVKIGPIYVQALFDTGSCASPISKDLFLKIEIKNTTVTA